MKRAVKRKNTLASMRFFHIMEHLEAYAQSWVESPRVEMLIREKLRRFAYRYNLCEDALMTQVERIVASKAARN